LPYASPEDAYASYLAEFGTDITEECNYRPPAEGGYCPLPGSLKEDLKEEVNVVLLLDASGSMQGAAGGETKMAIAKRVLRDFVGRLPKAANVALRVYGHVGSNSEADKRRSCRGSEAVLPLQPLDKRKFSRAIASFDARGWTPLARSLNKARGDFAGAHPKNSSNFVYVVSDGVETCGGDPVKQARALNRSDISVQVNIVGFDVDPVAAAQLRRAAQQGGGKFFQASNATELDRVFRENYDWNAWTAYYNCRWNEAHAEYNRTWNDEHGSYNCIWNAAHEEYNTLWNVSHEEYNTLWNATHEEYNRIWNVLHETDEYAAVRDDVLNLLQQRRDWLTSSMQEMRDYVLDIGERERDVLLSAARARRDSVLSEAHSERERTLQEAREQRDEHLD
jgi:Ca-activated chloride channel homolog